MEGPSAARLTSPRGGVHDKGDPVDMLGEEVWATVGTFDHPAGARMETAGDAPSSAMQDPPMATEQMTPTVVLVMGMGLGCPVQAQQRPRRSPPRAAAMEIEEIAWEPAQPP